jgi:hypothetical protein
MKKILLSIVSISLFAVQLQAQKWVSTTPQNRNVILEEFTGIHCGYCPDGHKIANNLVTSNPGRVFLVNIHSGSFAVPAAGEPDFRTTAGNAIDGSAGITGYPSGSLNRATTPWGQGRNLWSSQASTILAESSPINVYVKSSVDFATRELTTEVEVYYTADAATPTNYLTVALTENDILGPQSDYGNYNPTNWVDGKYKHNHVLRQLINTGNFGEAISKTSKGSYFYKKFVTTIPASYISIPATLYKMDVVAFVSENSNGSKIISGYGTPVDFDPTLKTDLALNDLTAKPNGYCFTSINPKVEVTNNLDQTVTSFDVSVFLNGFETKKSFTGSLAKGQKTTIDWGTLAFAPTGTYKVEIKGFKNINAGTLYDMESVNDNSTFSGFGFKAKAFTAFKDGFEGSLAFNSALDISQNPKVQITPNTTVKYGNFGSKYALLFYLHSSWNVAGKPGSYLIGEANLSSYTDPAVSYYYAYSDNNYGGTAPTIAVSVSEDCGVNWKTVNTTTAQETGQPTTANTLYDPKIGEYKYVIVPLTGLTNKNVLVKITGTPGTTGNALYIDEVRINSAKTLSVSNKVSSTPHVVLSPNPVSGIAQVDFELVKPSDIIFTVYNILNQVVYTRTLDAQGAGNHTESFDFSGLNKGVYTLEIKSGDAISTKKFIKD